MNKFNARKTEIDGIIFDSIREGNRYLELKMCMKARGEDKVAKLEMQPKFECIVNGKKICNYFADFKITYANGNIVYEDVKGVRTPLFILKKKLVEALFEIEITET